MLLERGKRLEAAPGERITFEVLASEVTVEMPPVFESFIADLSPRLLRNHRR
jgi:hypothetical protein